MARETTIIDRRPNQIPADLQEKIVQLQPGQVVRIKLNSLKFKKVNINDKSLNSIEIKKSNLLNDSNITIKDKFIIGEYSSG